MVKQNTSASQNIDFAEVMRMIEKVEHFRNWCGEVPSKILEESESLAEVLHATSHGQELWDYIYDPEAIEKIDPEYAIFDGRERLRYRFSYSLYPAVDEDCSSRISYSVRRSVMQRDDGACQMCGRSWHRPTGLDSECDSLLPSEWKPDFSSSESPVMDHIIPASYEGPGESWNVWVLCSSCNQEKFCDLWPPAIRRAVDRLRCGDGYKQIDPPSEEFTSYYDLVEGGG
jgi:hypothetical protein